MQASFARLPTFYVHIVRMPQEEISECRQGTRFWVVSVVICFAKVKL